MQDAMICGGADEYDTTTVAVFDNLLACSVKYNQTRRIAPLVPLMLGETGLWSERAAAQYFLKNMSLPKNVARRILGEVIGFACNNNGGDLILPNLDGITATLRLALKDAEIHPKDVDFVSAHATATKMGDVIEAQAIDAVYGDDPLNKPFVTGLKSYMGHTMGTCGVIETILTLYMMEQGFIAPTLNLENVDERCSMLAAYP